MIDWATTPATVTEIGVQALDDRRLLELMSDPAVSKVGIDAPFGWPLAFIDAVTTYRDGGGWLDLPHEELRFRATDSVVAEVTGQTPLSVATSDLVWPAMRLARLLTSFTSRDGPIDRAGGGRLAEVYPATALRCWEVIPPGTSVAQASYKGPKPGREDRRRSMMGALRTRLDGQVEISDAAFELCVADDDDLDAFVSALVARAVETGQCAPIPRGMHWAAAREGWIHLPLRDSLPMMAAA